ncbi:MAG: TetR/AcrR family transcriptional regulator C-terminal domain-containing protein [Chloroflexota bacterium]
MASKKAAGSTPGGRGHLGREVIVQTALDLMNQIGLDALSLRRLADELHVQAPALYWHFKNKQELLNEMAEAMILSAYTNTTVPTPADGVDWVDWLTVLARTLRQTLLNYRDGASLMASAEISSRSIPSLDLSLGILVEAGFSYPLAMIGIFTVVTYTLGFAFEKQASPDDDDDPEQMRQRIAGLPYLTAAFESGQIHLMGDEFEAGIQVIIDGLRIQYQQGRYSG